MKKITMILVGTCLLLGLVACGGDTPKVVMNDMVSLLDTYVTSMDKAENADDIVRIINDFSEGMQELAPRMKAIQEKYPELKDGVKGQLPEEFKEFEVKMKELGPRIMGTLSKMMQYANDPKVQEATKKFQEAMATFK